MSQNKSTEKKGKPCAFCHKLIDDFDLATDGVDCIKPVIYSPAVGDWLCLKSFLNEGDTL